MNVYFTSVVDKLSLEDIEVLNLLTKNNSTSKFAAISKRSIQSLSNLSEARFRKILYRLEAMNYVELVSGNKEHLLYVTEYGQQAIQCIYERGNE